MRGRVADEAGAPDRIDLLSGYLLSVTSRPPRRETAERPEYR
jgi:hypothetical protein